MGERTTFKAGEQSPLILFCNAKEQILLNKQLRILESMKKQVEAALTLDQRIVYNRFTLKLRRSELRHAKLFGNKHLVKQLSLSLFPDLHTKVMDGSKEAVRSVLENAEATRAISAPGKIQPPLALPVLIVQKHSCENLQGEKAEIKAGEKQLGVTEEIDVHLPNENYRSQGRVVKIPSEQQDLAPKPTEPSKSSSTKGFANQGLKEDRLEQKCKHSRRKKSHKPRPSTRNLFLRLDNTPLEIHPGTSRHIDTNQNESKVRLFIQKLIALQQEQSCPLPNYYSEQVLGNLEKTYQVNHDFLEETEEKCKWSPIGPETSHRSLTIKKVDWDFMRKESPLEMLTWEYYNEILTKENLMERNWSNNNPSQMATKQKNREFCFRANIKDKMLGYM